MSLTKLHKKAKIKGVIDIEDKKVVTAEFRLSYPSLFKAREYQGKESRSITMLFSKDVDLSPLEVAAQNACIEKWGADVSRWPSKKVFSKKKNKTIMKSKLWTPFRDGDIEKPDKAEYENMMFIKASNKKNQPGVCGPGPKFAEIKDESGIKAGDFCRAVLIANAWEEEGNAGVSFTLMSVQKLRTGEGFGGGRNAADEFAAHEYDYEETEEDEDNDYSEADESEEDDDTPEY